MEPIHPGTPVTINKAEPQFKGAVGVFEGYSRTHGFAIVTFDLATLAPKYRERLADPKVGRALIDPDAIVPLEE